MRQESIVAIFVAAAGLYLVSSVTGCGMSAGGMVVGTTGYLQEHNRGERLTMADRQQLNNLIRETTREKE